MIFLSRAMSVPRKQVRLINKITWMIMKKLPFNISYSICCVNLNLCLKTRIFLWQINNIHSTWKTIIWYFWDFGTTCKFKVNNHLASIYCGGCELELHSRHTRKLGSTDPIKAKFFWSGPSTQPILGLNLRPNLGFYAYGLTDCVTRLWPMGCMTEGIRESRPKAMMLPLCSFSLSDQEKIIFPTKFIVPSTSQTKPLMEVVFDDWKILGFFFVTK